MSYSISVQRYQAGELAPPDRVAVLAVLRRHCADSGGRFDSYDIGFADRSRVEFSAYGLETGIVEGPSWQFRNGGPGWVFRVREFSPLIVQFIFDVATAGDFTICNSMGTSNPAHPENPATIFMHPGQAAHFPAAPPLLPVHLRPCPNATVCMSVRHLTQLLRPGFARWEASYRPRRSWLARLISATAD